MKRTLVAFLSFIITAPVWAVQSGTTISGTIQDNMGSIPGAAVYISTNNTKGTITDANGNFSLTVPSTDTNVTIRMLGYKTQTLSASQVVSSSPIVLEEDTEEIAASVVTASEPNTEPEGDTNNNDDNSAPSGGQPCTSNDPNAASAKLEPVNGKFECLIVSCKNGWRPSNDKKTCVAVAGLSDEDYKKQMNELNANAQKMRANENSLANKTLGAAGMGATGIGGMMALSALAEQTADENAENDMRAYLNTFRCEYASGNGARGGDTNVELPGGNEMFNLYAQYATLSDDLRVRKNALGIKPGIESEIVIDKADTGLYDDVGSGITGGAYVSVARALTNTSGADAQKWAEQKSKTAKNLDTGKTTAIVGAAGSLVANLAMNSNVVNNADNILNTYEQLKTTPDAIVNAANVANAVSTTPPQQKGGINNNNDNTQSNSSLLPPHPSQSGEENTVLTESDNLGTNTDPNDQTKSSLTYCREEKECYPTHIGDNSHCEGIHQESTKEQYKESIIDKLKSTCQNNDGTFVTGNKTETNTCGTTNTYIEYICKFDTCDTSSDGTRCKNLFKTYFTQSQRIQATQTDISGSPECSGTHNACKLEMLTEEQYATARGWDK